MEEIKGIGRPTHRYGGGDRDSRDRRGLCYVHAAVVAGGRVPAASWSSIWYLLSSYAVISYTENWVYVAFAAAGSWIGAFASISFMHRPPGGPPIGAGPE